jgi:hypothetical protein
MTKLQVKGFGDLVRDTKSNAIVNTNKSEFKLYMAKIKNREKHSDEIRDAVKEINTLKKEFYEIKKLLIKVIGDEKH